MSVRFWPFYRCFFLKVVDGLFFPLCEEGKYLFWSAFYVEVSALNKNVDISTSIGCDRLLFKSNK